MEHRKLTKADIDKVRDIEGFPNAEDDDIIALSDAPYYTACPNPFIEDFIRENGHPYDETADDYQREPFAFDVSEGKTDIIYGAHNYHTKVPYKAIMQYILHYTNPGDIVLDGFSGSGMTGVAAQKCGEISEIQALSKIIPNAECGVRNVVLNDLSPAATFISKGQNESVDVNHYTTIATEVLEKSESEYGWVYETNHISSQGKIFQTKGIINYTVWSDVFVCPTCGSEIVFTESQKISGNLKDAFICPSCGRKMKKAECRRAQDIVFDEFVGETINIAKQVPVLINYTFQGKKYEKKPDSEDLECIEKISHIVIPYTVPIYKLPKGYNTDQPRKSHGIEYMHQFYTKRNLYAISVIFNNIRKYEMKDRHTLTFTFEQILMGMSKIARYVPSHYSQVNQYLSGTLYIGSQVVEVTPRYILENKIKSLSKVYRSTAYSGKNAIVSTGSTTNLPVPDISIDYIFTDPPFGANLNYSELSFIWEAWHNVLTNNATEAIMNPVQNKSLVEYQGLMTQCFHEYYRVLKPNRWITVEFHNSQNSVWNAIQEAIQRSGFIIADVRTLDKKQGSFKQVVSTSAVKQDLVISAYKPKESFSREFKLRAGTEKTAWSFIRQHLSNVPITIKKGGQLEVIAERQAFLLWDRMVAYHIMNGLAVPMDAADFYHGLDEKYLKRDGMYFLPGQVNKYDKVRSSCDVENIQFSLFVSDEKSAIGWLYQQLDRNNGCGPQTYAELQPKFMQELKAVDKREKMPELMVILEENFLKDKDGKWYIPDFTKNGDIAKLREKNLWKEFEEYMNSKGKLTKFRSEAIRVGFSRLWKAKDYQSIVNVAERLPEATIQEDANLLMYYDISLSRI